jgi:multiple sugar transport system ATP-binding protein
MSGGSARIELHGIAKRFGDTVVLQDIDLSIAPGEFFSLLGPSGCGKTTTLRIIAGLETPDAGRVYVDGRDITDMSPGERDAAMVFQSYALYPHMTVAGNIGFPLRMVGTARSEIERLVVQAARRVGIEPFLARRPGQLSGGQQQRVALARAIVRSPRLFLLDEPLSNLDAKLRVQTRTEVKQLQRALGVTTIYVTHDQEEAMSLSDRMAIFVDGRIVQIGTPEEVFGKPTSITVAGFLGSPPMNLLPARLRGAVLEIEGHGLALPWPGGDEDRAVVAGIRPGDITIGEAGLPAMVELAEPQGESVIVDLRLGSAALKARIFSGARFREGQEVRIGIDPTRVHLFDPAGERLDRASRCA